jgi:hypothetical protein
VNNTSYGLRAVELPRAGPRSRDALTRIDFLELQAQSLQELLSRPRERPLSHLLPPHGVVQALLLKQIGVPS